MSEQDGKISQFFTELTALRIVVQELVGRRALETNNPQLFVDNLKTAAVNDLSRITLSEQPHDDDEAFRNDVQEAIGRLLAELKIPRKIEAE